MSCFAVIRRALCALSLVFALGADPSRAEVPAPSAPTGGAHNATDRSVPLVPQSPPPLVVGHLETENFRIHYTAHSKGAAHALAERIEDVRKAFRSTFGRDWPGRTEIRLGLGREEFEALAMGGRPPRWAVALAYPDHNVLLLEAGSLAAPDGHTTLNHELAHVALGRLGSSWPHWFQEGVAMHLSGERFALNQYAVLFRATRLERIFRFEDLAEGWPTHPSDVEIAYAQSLSFVEYLVDNHGPERLGSLIDGVRDGEAFETAFARAFGDSIRLREQAWRDQLPLRYAWLPFSVGNSLLWLGAAGLCVAAYLVRRARKAKRLEELAAEDAAEDAARQLMATDAIMIDPYPQEPTERTGLGDDFDPFEEPKNSPPNKPTIH